MFTRKNSVTGLVVAFLLSITACAVKDSYSANVEDLNGTWVDVKDHRNSPKIKEREYSWGIGKRIVETTLEVELDRGKVLLPGTGAFFIQGNPNKATSGIVVNIKGPGEDGGWKMKLVFHFIDKDTFWIECADLEGMFSVGKNKPWYRLSGPSKK